MERLGRGWVPSNGSVRPLKDIELPKGKDKDWSVCFNLDEDTLMTGRIMQMRLPEWLATRTKSHVVAEFPMNACWFVVILVIVWVIECHGGYEYLERPAFCASPAGRPFPLGDGVSSHCAKPWVWDAIYNPLIGRMEVLLMPRSACYHNSTARMSLLSKQPIYRKYLSYSTLTAPICPRRDEPAKELIGKQVVLQYSLLDGSSLMVMSEVIRGSLQHFADAPLRIEFNAISTQIDTQSQVKLIVFKEVSQRIAAEGSVVQFPFCSIRRTAAAGSGSGAGEVTRKKPHDIAICTSTGNRNIAELLEWLRYYRNIGESPSLARSCWSV